MSPGRQLLMDGFPPPRDYMTGVRRLSVGQRLSVVIYDMDDMTGSEIAEIENLLYCGFDAHDSELTLHFSEYVPKTERQ